MIFKFFTIFLFLFSTTAFSATKEGILALKKDDVAFGNKDAKVVMISYDSYSCGHCADFYLNDFKVLEKKYIKTGKLLFIHREYPLDAKALSATKLMQCKKWDAVKQQKMIHALFSSQDSWVMAPKYNEVLRDMFVLYGLTTEEAEGCIADSKKDRTLATQMLEARDLLQIVGTPSFFINGKKVVMKEGKRVDIISAAIDSEL